MIKKLRNKWIELNDGDIRGIRKRKLSYLQPSDLVELRKSIAEVQKKNIEGLFIEAGSALGGSAIYISRYKKKEREFRIYDMFGMIPPTSENDTQAEKARYQVIVEGKSKGIGGDEYYGYKENLLQEVKDNFQAFNLSPEENNVKFFKGDFKETMHIEEKVAFAHIDCDWYDSVYYCLSQIAPRLSVGGVIILDDYFHWDSCKKATEDFLKSHSHKLKKVSKSKMHLVKR